MGNGNISFEIEGVKHSLFFGMVATEIIEELSVKAANENKLGSQINNLKAFAYVVFGGLCNKADSMDVQRPEFTEAYIIADAIWLDQELSTKIYKTWEESKPCVELMKRIGTAPDKKKDEVKPKPRTGKK